jgi:FemAB-related protein (PEP-CTERM system-associated)
MSVSLSHQINWPLWDAFVKAHPFGSPFHLSNWQKTIQSTFGHKPLHIVAADSKGEVVGVLPLFLVRSRLFGRMLVSTPQAAYGGILASSEAITNQVLIRAQQLARELNVEIPGITWFSQFDSERHAVCRRTFTLHFVRNSIAEPETNMLAIPRKTRAEVREGIKHGLEFNADAIGTREFFNIYSHSVHNLGTPVFPRSLFQNGLKEFGAECKIFSVHWKDKLVAAVWTLFYKDEVVPYFGGSLREYNRLAANNFMYWMLMKYGCENGYKVFDFGRSKKGTGSFDFKKRWGMTMTDLPYQYALVRQTSMPDTSPLNPKFSFGIQAWRKLPLSLTRVIGPVISRHVI